jgi:uncharacterized protein YlaI
MTMASRRLGAAAPANTLAPIYELICDGCATRTTAKHKSGWRTLVLNRGFLEISDGAAEHVVEFHLCGDCDDELDENNVMRALVTVIQK